MKVMKRRYRIVARGEQEIIARCNAFILGEQKFWNSLAIVKTFDEAEKFVDVTEIGIIVDDK